MGAETPTLGSGLSFGQRLRALRIGHLLSVAELGRRAGCTQDQIRDWERDNASPRLNVALALADALETMPSLLLFERVTLWPFWLRDASAEGFGLRLRTFRKKRGLSADAVAHAIGLRTGETVYVLERGENLPTVRQVELLAGLLRVAPELLGLWIYPAESGEA